MDARSVVSRFCHTAAAGALAFVVPLSGFALDRTSGAILTITVHPDRYDAAGVSFPDLDALEALVKPMRPSLVRLGACGRGSTDALLAAAERFEGSRLEIDVLAATAPGCAAAPARMVRVSQVLGPVPAGAASARPDRYWQRVMP
ncbi:MAG TPA: hypothetical protein VLD36_22520 [Burkholderiales bacterium]|nr:hypothetical protein [Burkholderiales bacterium]